MAAPTLFSSQGPEVLSSCGNLSLSGSQSFGSGGRPLIFEWSLTSPKAGNDATAITSVLSGLSSDDDRVKIHGELLEAGKQYVFKLKVANFLNPSGFEEATHSVIKASDPVPALTLSSSIDLSEGEVFVSEDLSIKASAIVSTSAVVYNGGYRFLLLLLLLHHHHHFFFLLLLPLLI